MCRLKQTDESDKKANASDKPVQCSWTGERRALKDHVRKACRLCRLRCKKCGEVVLRHNDDHHLQHQCRMRKSACSQCSVLVPWNEMSEHNAKDCSQTLLDCPNKCDDKQRTRLELQNTHRDVCPNATIECFCGDKMRRAVYETSHLGALMTPASIAKHLQSVMPLRAQVLALSDEQKHLKSRVQELEGRLQSMSGDLDARSRHSGRFLAGSAGWDIATLQVGEVVDVLDRKHGAWLLAEIVGKSVESKWLEIAVAGYATSERTPIKTYFDADAVAPAFSRCFKAPLHAVPARLLRFGEREFGKDNRILRFSELSSGSSSSPALGAGSSSMVAFDQGLLDLLRSEGTPLVMLERRDIHENGGWTCCGAQTRSARGCRLH